MAAQRFCDLSVEEVGVWLASVKLDKAFRHEFAEQDINGDLLHDAEEGDFDAADYPKAKKIREDHDTHAPHTCTHTRTQYSIDTLS